MAAGVTYKQIHINSPVYTVECIWYMSILIGGNEDGLK